MPPRSGHHDVAIVGMACRLPGGVASPDDLWSLLIEGRNAISEIGPDRWATHRLYHPRPDMPGKSYTWRAGVLDGLDGFDAEFFQVSPREAGQVDPQQRLLLELAVEALEDAGHGRSSVAGTNGSVFIGVSGVDFATRRSPDPASGNAYGVLGQALSISANRVSYFLDLKGPSIAVDTACSSSMVALHLGCRSLIDDGAPFALVGGVNALLSPFAFIGFSKATMLSPEGICRAFDADGKGYVRAEGGVVLMLKTLDRAQRDGDPIHAVIRATGTNADGRTTGLSMPSAESQRALLSRLYADNGIDPADLVYLEAHGTGTMVGDPMEATAIGEGLAQRRPAGRSLPIGSIKTNLGHLEPASGLAGVLKATLILKHGVVPPSLHFRTPNPQIDFAGLNIRVVAEPEPMERTRTPAIIGVNSFGFGGTNAHAILTEQRRAAPPKETAPVAASPLLLSAHRPEALAEMARRHADWLTGPGAGRLYDAAWTRAHRRDALPHRLAVASGTADEVELRLRAFAAGEAVRGTVSGRAAAGPGRLALVFSGNGCQWFGMGAALLETSPIFRDALMRIDAIFAPLSGWSLVTEMQDGSADSFVDTEFAQPLLFGLQVAAWESLRAHGLVADAVLGHSVGEVSAAHVAGALSLDDAVRVIYERSAAQGSTKGAGKMAALGVTEETARADIEALGLPLEIAGLNAPTTVVVAGPTDAIRQLQGVYEARDRFVRVLDLEYPFHSRVMDGLRAGLLDRLAGLRPRPARIPYISAVTGAHLPGEDLGADYWWRNVREPVRFSAAIETLAANGYNAFLEIGPQPILQVAIRETARTAGVDAAVLWSLNKREHDALRLTEAVLQTWTAGCRLDTDRAFPAPGRVCRLPTYPWQREHHWFAQTMEASDMFHARRLHPLLGYAVPHAADTWENEFDAAVQTDLADHAVGGAAVFPAASFAEIAAAAARAVAGDGSVDIADLEIRRPLMLEAGVTKVVRTRVDSDRRLVIEGRNRITDSDFSEYCVARLVHAVDRNGATATSPSTLWPGHGTTVDATTHYARASAAGLDYGPAFRRVAAVSVHNHTAVARLSASPDARGGDDACFVDPAELDAGFQLLIDILLEQDGAAAAPATLYLPQRIGRLRVAQPGVAAVFARAKVLRMGTRSVVADIDLFDADGRCVATASACRFRQAPVRSEAETPLYAFAAVPQEAPKVDEPAACSTRRLAEVATAALQESRSHLASACRPDDAALFVDAVAAAFAERALRAIGAGDGPFAVDAFAETSGVAPTALPLLHRLCEMLVEDGVLVGGDDGLVLTPSEDRPAATDVWRAFVAEHPDFLAEASLLGRAGRNLPHILCAGDEAPDFLTGETAHPTLDHLTTSSPGWAGVNAALARMLREIAAAWPQLRPLRVLEIGGGTGRIHRRVLEALRGIRCDYVLTDADDAALTRVRGDFADMPFVRCRQLDPTSDESVDEFGEDGFDVAIAANVLHLGDDTAGTLRRMRRLLRRHGVLLAVHRGADRFTDMVFGSDPAWWRPDINGRSPASRLASTRQWKVMLGDAGFTAPPQVVGGDEEAPNGETVVVIAENPAAERTEAKASAAAAPNDQAWLLLADPRSSTAGLAAALRTHLSAAEECVVTVTPGAAFRRCGGGVYEAALANADDAAALFAALAEDGITATRVVELKGAGNEADPATRCAHVMDLVRALSAGGIRPTPRLHLVTRGGMALEPGDAGAPEQSVLWGLARVLANELPGVPIKLVDLRLDGAPAIIAERLAAELRLDDDEDEVVLTPAGRRAVRLQSVPAWAPTPGGRRRRRRSFRLETSMPGALDRLHWRQSERRPPGPGEVEIRVRAAGLNFRDVMWAMGLLPDEAVEDGYAGPTLGIECAGDVVAVGAGVDDFAVGDAVISFASACFADHVTTETIGVHHMPPEISYAQAATIPTAFLTAFYALAHLARLSEGESVLIHGGAGGVGLAAIQYAKACGATVFATAGSDEKRTFLELLGVDHVLNSRTLAFPEEIMERTGGAGVDVVLNCLAGDAMVRSLEVLRPFGRFLELGKRDLFADSRIGLRPLRNNVTYFAIDADQLLVEQRPLAVKLFEEVLDCFARGVFRPLVLRTFPADDVVEAFRHMQQSRHVGKVVIDLQDAPQQVQTPTPAHAPLVLDPEATYLVVGGLGGFGLATAERFAARGARHLTLVGRRGAVTPEAEAGVAALQAAGVTVRVAACDVADATAVDALFEAIADGPPLAGIVHAAMVLDDARALDLDRDRFETVFRPKIKGAWNLHNASRRLPLQFFVLYSSATTLVGNPGQANYVAANVYLEQLARHRRAAGLPACAIAWGALGDVGYLADNATIREAQVHRLGGRLLTSSDALDVMERVLAQDLGDVAAIDLDWRLVKQTLPMARSPVLADIMRQVPDLPPGAMGAQSIRAQLAGLPPEEAVEVVRGLLVAQVADVLRLPPDRVDTTRPLAEAGMDSLMGLELGLALERELGVTLPPLSLGEQTGIDTLAQELVRRLTSGDDLAADDDHVVAGVFARHMDSTDHAELEELVGTGDGLDTSGSRLLQ